MQQQTVTLIGHLTADPLYWEFGTGKKLARFRLGTSRRVRSSQSTSGAAHADFAERDQLYIDVEVWGNLAVNVNESLAKGKPVICVGYLVTQEWNDKAGEKRTKVVLRALYVGFELRNYVINYCRNPLPVEHHIGGADLNRFRQQEQEALAAAGAAEAVQAAEAATATATAASAETAVGVGMVHRSTTADAAPDTTVKPAANATSPAAPTEMPASAADMAEAFAAMPDVPMPASELPASEPPESALAAAVPRF